MVDAVWSTVGQNGWTSDRLVNGGSLRAAPCALRVARSHRGADSGQGTEVVEQRSRPSTVWFVVAGVVFVASVVTGTLVAKSGAANKVRSLVSTQVGPANSGHIYFEDHLRRGTYALVYTAPGLARRSDVPLVTLLVRRVGGQVVPARVKPSDAYLDPSYSATSTTYRSRGRVEVAVFVTPVSGQYHLEGQIRPAPPTGASTTPPSLADGELRLYPYRLRDESDKVFNGIFGVLSRVGLGILIGAFGFVTALGIVIVVAVTRDRANRPPPQPPAPYGPWSGPPGPGGPWAGGPWAGPLGAGPPGAGPPAPGAAVPWSGPPGVPPVPSDAPPAGGWPPPSSGGR